MLPVMLKAPATAARTRPAAASSNNASVTHLPSIRAQARPQRSSCILKLQWRHPQNAALAGQGDTVLSDGSFKTTTNSSASGSSTMTAPQPVQPKQQPSTQETFSQSPAKPTPAAEAEAEAAKDAHHFDWNKQW
jgi:hypothetical protein